MYLVEESRFFEKNIFISKRGSILDASSSEITQRFCPLTFQRVFELRLYFKKKKEKERLS